MKLHLFTILFISFISYTFSQNNVTIYGKIINPKDDTVFIKNDFYKGYNPVSKGILDKNGNFKLSFKINDTATYYFLHGDERTEMYLMPGFNLKLTIDTKQFDESVHYEGEGEKYNNYLAKKLLFFENIDNVIDYGDDEQTFLKKIDSTEKIKFNFIERYAKFDKNLLNKEKNEYFQKKYYNLFMYPIRKKYFVDSTFTVSKNYPDPFSDLDPNNSDLLKVNLYKDNVMQFISQKITPYDSLYYDRFIDTTIKYISNNQVKNEILTKMLANNHLDYKTFAKLYIKAKPLITSDIQIKKLDSISNILFKVSEGQPSPAFAFEDINGNIVRLEDIKGSFLYIDIWATWCKPCIQEYGYLISIEDSLKNKNIKFVSICYDDNKDRWKKVITNNKLSGIQLFAPDKNDQFFKSYMVEGVPYFILLDPNNLIVSNNDSRIRPSSKGSLNYLKNTIQGLNKSK